ncbi:reverse transcriptase [Senna tora]|uniref:Reverse transcriptase n=1 Tax=Senna tora TaxID=362788 RepID=A0A834TUJ1_9FABA|nr:reverse transcriptase [Senna tora]
MLHKPHTTTFGSFHSPPKLPTMVSLPTPATPKIPTTTHPSVSFSDSEVSEIQSPWLASIIVRLIGSFIEQSSLMSNLIHIWKLKSNPNLLSLGSGFFIVSFGCTEDRWKALLHGPTMINGHLLSIKPWQPGFSTETEDSSIFSLVWVKLVGLPIEFFNLNALIRIGNSIGQFLGIDAPTHNLTSARCARICILLNLNRPTPPFIDLRGHLQIVTLERISGFCITCGGTNHSLADCRGKKVINQQTAKNAKNSWTQVHRKSSQTTGREMSTDHQKNSNSTSHNSFDPLTLPDTRQTEDLPTPSDLVIATSKVVDTFPTPAPKGSNVLSPTKSQKRNISAKKIAHTPDPGLNPSLFQPTYPEGHLETHTSAVIPNLVLDIASIRNNVLASMEKEESQTQNKERDSYQIESQPTTLVNPPPIKHTPEKVALTSSANASPPSSSIGKGKTRPSSSPTLPQTNTNPQETLPKTRNQAKRALCRPLQNPGHHPNEGSPLRHPNATIAGDSPTPNQPGCNSLLPMETLGELHGRSSNPSELVTRLEPPTIRSHIPCNGRPGAEDSNVKLTCQRITSLNAPIGGPDPESSPSPTAKCQEPREPPDISPRPPLSPKKHLTQRKSTRLRGIPDIGGEIGAIEYQLLAIPHLSLKPLEPVPEELMFSPDSQGHVGQNFLTEDYIMNPISILAWNARGAASADFRRTFSDIYQRHKPSVVFISETRIGGIRAEQIIRSLPHDGYFKVDPMGFAGGLWLLWHPEEVRMTVHSSTFQDITATIQETLRLEEELWASKARLDWLQLGDSNTSFFHNSVIHRRRTNRINALKDTVGNWFYTPEDINNHITSYFSACFTATHISPIPTDILFNRIPPSYHTPLSSTPSAEEIKNALFSLKPFKAAGADGFQPAFFQKFWDVLKPDLINNIQACFTSSTIPSFWNETLICLIPKTQQPSEIRNFRPISLCTTLYKIISKIIVLRIKPLMPNLISFNQGAYIQGRKARDNVIISQEIIHSFKKKRGTKWGWMIIKLDLEKAFDKVDWSFIISLLHKFDFPSSLINLIESSLSSVRHKILINGGTSNEITPSRGIQQGDPLSPLLFISCMQLLSAVIDDQVSSKKWTPASIRSIKISHLLFADDVLLFSRVDKKSIVSINRSLDLFLSCSGLSVNKRKSLIWFSPNTNDLHKREAINKLQFSCSIDPGNYLGFPLGIKGKASEFRPILEKIKSKMESWNSRFLSTAGKGLIQGHALLEKGLISVIYSGRDTSVWFDNWIHDSPLRNQCQGPLNASDLNLKVSDFSHDLGSWHWDRISFELPRCIIDKINAIPIWKDSNRPDQKVWRNSIESISHLLKDCPISSILWIKLNISSNNVHSSDFLGWLKSNTTNDSLSLLNVPSGTSFIYCLWHLWRARNDLIFNNQSFNILSVLKKGLAASAEFHHLAAQAPNTSQVNSIFVRWHPPDPNWWKLNCDGACSGNPGPFAIGGLIRDEYGNWVKGFSSFIGYGIAFTAEVWAIIVGLKLAMNLNCHYLCVESDSLLAVNLLNDSNVSTSHHLYNLINWCRSILSRFTEVKIIHSFREGNSCADSLARHALLNQSRMSIFDAIPSHVRLNFLADLHKVSFSRIVPTTASFSC